MKYKADELGFCPECNIGINVQERSLRYCQNCSAHWDEMGIVEHECWNDDEWGDSDDEEDEFERAMDECGEMPGGGCQLAGTEYCDWECPFSKQMYANMARPRDTKGRFCKVENETNNAA